MSATHIEQDGSQMGLLPGTRWLLVLSFWLLVSPGCGGPRPATRDIEVGERDETEREVAGGESSWGTADKDTTACSGQISEPRARRVPEETVEETRRGIELVFATEYTDGGTYSVRLRYRSGRERVFCVSTKDCYPGRWLPNRLYVGAEYPTDADARLVPSGSDEELRIIQDLAGALAAYQTEEGKREYERLPKGDSVGKQRQIVCAEGCLRRLYEVTGRKPDAIGDIAPGEWERGEEHVIAKIAAMGGRVTGLPARKVSFRGKPLTDEQLACVEELASIKSLDLCSTQISDGGLERLKKLTNLEELVLSGTQVSDTGLMYLEGLSKLKKLALSDTKVTDAGLGYVKGRTGLEWLFLDGTRVSDVGLEVVGGLSNLRMLGLSSTQVSDRGLEHLRHAENLEALFMLDTRISDAGLEHLKKLANLKVLYLDERRVSAEGVRRLQEALPTCRVRVTVEAVHGTSRP